jgi:hypothetical protein
MGAINDAEAFIAAASAQKREDLAKRAKEIRWHITSLFEYRWKHKLGARLDIAVNEMNDICDQREAMFAARVQAARDAWTSCVAAETDALDAHTAQKDQDCDDAQAEQTGIFNQYVADALARFDAWAAAVAEDMDNHIADCEDAWQWILKSYCLVKNPYSHKDERHYLDEHFGHGCGHGYGYHNIHRKDKSVPIEEHGDILSYGQDLEIKGIDDLDGRRAKTVDLAMNTYPDFLAGLQAGVEQAQQDINDATAAERARLEGDLATRLADSIASLDATVARLEAWLRAQLAAAQAQNSAETDAAIAAIEALKD